MNTASGSCWAIWDLHIHTPCSYTHGYPGVDQDERWELFLTDLENLPPDFKVLGINDYLSIDGYRKLRDFKAAGRLANIDLLLPVVELRIKEFAGHDQLKRLNFHVIFSQLLDPRVIEDRFIRQLHAGYRLRPDDKWETWVDFVNPDSIRELGEKVRASVPPHEGPRFTESDFVLGMNSLNFSPADIGKILETNQFRDAHVTAIGKAEWDQLRWSGSIAEKKHIINSAGLVFTASENAAAYERAHSALRGAAVNSKLMDCSDAHHPADSREKDRIGNCFSWVKADPDFEGLRMAIHYFDQRVFVGSCPGSLMRVRSNQARYLRSVRFNKTDRPGMDDSWFDKVEVPLNYGLVAVIGNKGKGKSALLDSVALAANAHTAKDDFSFLFRFANPKDNKAKHFECELEWWSGRGPSVQLDSEPDLNGPELVRHLPQHFIEKLCNTETGDFTKELKRVIFSHVPEEERVGKTNLDGLIEYLSLPQMTELASTKAKLTDLNREISQLEKDIQPPCIEACEKELNQTLAELESKWLSRPEPAPLPTHRQDADAVERHRTTSTRIDLLERKVEAAGKKLNESTRAIKSAQQAKSFVEQIPDLIADVKAKVENDLRVLGIDFHSIVTWKIELGPLDAAIDNARATQADLRASLNPQCEGSLAANLAAEKAALQELKNQLEGPSRQYEQYSTACKELISSVHELIGDKSEPAQDTIRGLRQRLDFLNSDARRALHTLYATRRDVARGIHRTKRKLARIHEDLYQPVQDFVEKHRNDPDISFRAALRAQDFESKFFDYVSLAKKGSFYGQAGPKRWRGIVDPVELDDEDQVVEMLETLVQHLMKDARSENGAATDVCSQLKGGESAEFYDFLYFMDYLNPYPELRLQGRELTHLSPGERGSLLLVFYLLLDGSDRPLLIDQPEENLDNQSVFSTLVPLLREASSRRQVVVVTHNPNIAVACGADQVIRCDITRDKGVIVSYEAGALECLALNKAALDVLEGTLPAFRRRDDSYYITKRSETEG